MANHRIAVASGTVAKPRSSAAPPRSPEQLVGSGGKTPLCGVGVGRTKPSLAQPGRALRPNPRAQSLGMARRVFAVPRAFRAMFLMNMKLWNWDLIGFGVVASVAAVYFYCGWMWSQSRIGMNSVYLRRSFFFPE